jgi:hypothetical protein
MLGILQRDLDPTGAIALILGLCLMQVELNDKVHFQPNLLNQIAQVCGVVYLKFDLLRSLCILIFTLLQKMNVKYIIAPLHIVPAHYVLAVADVQARTLSVFDPMQHSCCIGDRDERDVADLIDKIIVCLPFPYLLVSQGAECSDRSFYCREPSH